MSRNPLRGAFMAAVLFAVSASGCGGPAAVFLRIEAPLVVPEQADAVRVEIDRATGGERLSEETFDLHDGPSFPLTLTVETRRDELLDETLRVRATVLKDGAQATPWSSGEVDVVLKPRELTPATIKLCDCEQ